LLEDKSPYYVGHPCYWPIHWLRITDTKLVFTRVKSVPYAYKRVRVSVGVEGDGCRPRSSWMRDLDKEREVCVCVCVNPKP
jgi:hypothetical protein